MTDITYAPKGQLRVHITKLILCAFSITYCLEYGAKMRRLCFLEFLAQALQIIICFGVGDA
jgi:hypothetical protein